MELLYKYMPSKFVRPFVREGRILFRNLTYFRQHYDRARGDQGEGVHVDDPDNPVTISDPSTGRVRSRGDFRFLNSVNQDRLFVFCLSKSFDPGLFDEFQADACIIIREPEAFFLRCEQAAKRLFRPEPPGLIHKKVTYYKPNEPSDLSVKDPKELPFLKHSDFSYQNEYRAVFAHGGGFKLLQRLVTRQFTFDDEVKEGTASRRTLRLGNIERLVDVVYKAKIAA